MYIVNIQNIKSLAERTFKYDLGDARNITKLNNSSAANMKDKWDFNDQTIIIEHFSQVEIVTVKKYQWDSNQFSTNDGVKIN